jgi:hypothetical protein
MGGGDEVAMLNIWAEDRKMMVMGTQGPWPGNIPTFRISCAGSSEPPVDMPLVASLGWFNVAPEHTDLSSDGRSFRGDFISRPHAANTIRFVYRFNVSP